MKLTALQVRIYYITCELKAQELMFTGGRWVLGVTLGDVMPGSLSLYAAVRTDRTTGTLIQIRGRISDPNQSSDYYRVVL
jgi:hypothetical protein